ncbi:MAG TPA: ATP-binding protein, partial [Naasia sp.]
IAGRVAGFAGWSIDATTGVLEVSDGIEDIRGFAVGRGLHWTATVNRVQEPVREVARAQIARALRSGEPIDLTLTLPHAAGHPVVIRLLGEAVRDERGEVVRIDGAYSDVTHVVAAERGQQRREQKVTARLDQMAVGIVFVSRDWRFTYVNETGQQYLQKGLPELLGKNIWEVFPQIADTEFGRAYRRAMDEGVSASARDYFEPLGAWFEVRAYPIEDGIAVQVVDVSDDQATMLQLEETARRLRAQAALLDAARDSILVVTLDERILYCNASMERASGWELAELKGHRVGDLLYADRPAFDSARRALQVTGHWEGELRRRAKDGRMMLMDCRWQVMSDDQGTPSSVFAVESDITEARSAEDQRYREQRLTSLGTLAGGIAHDLNNVLTPILLGAQLLEAGETDKRRRELLGTIVSGAKRGAQLINQVLQFARGEGGERREVDVAALLREVAALARETLPKTVSVEMDVPGALPHVVGDPTQLFQVLVNLVTNAGDAMPGGGRMTVSARHDRPGARLVLQVTDTGTGMGPETLPRIFEPFFTTKERGRGTGLGLSTSLSIVRAHQGSLEVDSAPGSGSAFTLRLPVVAALRDDPVPGAGRPEVQQGRGERVLIVDDEPDVRRFADEVLRGAGYRTRVAEDGSSAIRLLAESEVDLLLIDMMMPGLGGAETVQRITELVPSLPTVAMSGYDADTATHLRREEHPARFLAKPFSVADLLTVVRGALDARPGAGE